MSETEALHQRAVAYRSSQSVLKVKLDLEMDHTWYWRFMQQQAPRCPRCQGMIVKRPRVQGVPFLTVKEDQHCFHQFQWHWDKWKVPLYLQRLWGQVYFGREATDE